MSQPAAMEQADPTTTEERQLAALAHVAFLGGFWIIGPLVIYAWKGKESRFIAFHAAQAGVLGALSAVLGVGGGILVLVGMVGMAALGAALRSTTVQAIGMLLFTGVPALLMLVPLVVSMVAAWRAYHGRWWSVPLAGRLAAKLIEKRAL